MKPKKNLSPKFWLLIFILSLIVAVITQHLVDIENLVATAGIYGPLISVLLYVVLSFTPIPSDPITVICGAVYGPRAGLIISTIGNTLAGIVEYLFFKNIGKSATIEASLKKLPPFLQSKSVHSSFFLLSVRFLPGFGGKIASIAAGVYQVNFFKFLWTTAVASLIGSIMFAYGGWGISRFAAH